MSQSRDHFRIPFPIEQRPKLIVGAVEFEVIDLSECGARIVRDGPWPDRANGPVAATIRFGDDTTADVTAEVQRQEGCQLILRFGRQLSYSVIAAEQQRLLRLYPRTTLQPSTPTAANT